MSYSVIIPSNVADKLRRCVLSIIATHPSLDLSKIIVVDDGARARWDDENDPPVTWVGGVRPFIYSRNVNLGIRMAGADDVVVIGDDVTIRTPGCFDLLAETARRPYVAAVSPTIEGPVGNPFQQRRVLSNSIRESPVELCFVCVYLPRSYLNAVGLLDERFDGYGCEDVDWSWRAQDLDARLLVDGRASIIHNDVGMPSAFREQADIGEKSQKAREILKAKWPEKFPKDRK